MKPTATSARVLLALSAFGLLGVWVCAHGREILAEQNGLVRAGLAAVFAALILLRRKPPSPEPAARPARTAILGVGGLALAVAGLVAGVRQCEWAGVVMVAAAALLGALPPRSAADVCRAGFVLFWAHPLPNRLFEFLQLALQRLSVGLSEGLLHAVNVRVWADGLVLRTGLNAFEVPAWCSGMRTATTVFVLALGLGVLGRLGWSQTALLAVLAVVQALALNVLRISAMVILSPAAVRAPADAFLHDTAGILALAAVALVYGELLLLLRWRAARAARRQELNPLARRMLTDTPHPLHGLVAYRWAILALLAAAAAVGVVVGRSRPLHRALMVRDVALALRDTGQLEAAQRAVDAVAPLLPADPQWQMTVTRLLVLRGRYDEALRALDAMPDSADQGLQKRVLQAYSLMGLDRTGEAARLVQSLPAAAREHDPRVNMVLAELARRADDPAAVARSVRVAAGWPPNAVRIRNLYPYLRSRGEWAAIVDSDVRSRFVVPEQALAAAEAYMNANNVPQVADVAIAAARDWPYDHRVLEPLFFLAMKREDAWEQFFVGQFDRCLPRMERADDLYGLLQKCFELVRPDLAWRVHRRLGERDPGSPYLAMAAARYGAVWFTFRKRQLGMEAPSALDSLDLRPHFALARLFGGWRPLGDAAPLAAELLVPDPLPARKRLLAAAVRGFGERAAAGSLTLPMRYTYAGALEIAGDVPAACAVLDGIASDQPAERARARIVRSEIHERGGDWQSVYEDLRTYAADEPRPALLPLLRLGQAQARLQFWPAALATALRAAECFPESTQAAALRAAILLRLDLPEDALQGLARRLPRRQLEVDLLEAEALYRTQRYSALDSHVRAVLLPQLTLPEAAPQDLFLPPATLSLLWHRFHSPTDADCTNHAARIAAALPATTVPFARDLGALWLRCLQARCEGDTALPAVWEACGRDRVEKAVALNQLCLMLCWRQRFSEARTAAEAAAGHLPECPVLWHAAIGLSGGDAAVLRRAREACPRDGEVWLADLTRRIQGFAPAGPSAATNAVPSPDALARIGREVGEAAAGDVFSPAVMARAAELLYRCGQPGLAAEAIRDALPRAQGLLPVHVLGIRCAVAGRDADWAMENVRLAIGASLNPPAALYEKLVDLKCLDGEVDTDSDMVQALRALRSEQPDNTRWAQILGFVRFKRGGWEIVDSLYQMTAAIEGGATNRVPFAVGAEAARQLGDYARATELLRKGLATHPGDLALLNNLVYTLAFDPATIREAQAMLPALLERAGAELQIQDTAAVVHLRANNLVQAEGVAAQMLKQSAAGTVPWFRARMYEAAVALKRGQPEGAARMLRRILADSRSIPDDDVLAATRLLAESGGGAEITRGPAAPPEPAP